MTDRLTDKTCIITGAGRGIGRATALAFGEAGANVLVNDLDEEAAEEVAAAIRDGGGMARANFERIGSTAAAESLIMDAVEHFGKVDVLVNNAGLMRDRMTHKMTEEEFDSVIEVNLRGTWACGQAAIRHWYPLAKEETSSGQAKVRKIINVTSASGLKGAAGQSNYSSAKMAIVGLTYTWAKEYGALNITCNAVAPTALTRLTAPLLDDDDAARERLARFPLGRYALPEEVARTYVFLASADSDYMTGSVIRIDGGLAI
jgi:3-oxoacyl-[acyl-carrier protein] reductase